jgi:hypothetical protein
MNATDDCYHPVDITTGGVKTGILVDRAKSTGSGEALGAPLTIEKAGWPMWAERLRVRVGEAVAVGGAALLAAGCVSATTPLNATPTMSPTPVPTLGNLTLAQFPSTVNGVTALDLCEGWAGLRGQYVSEVQEDTPLQLDDWFSGSAWSPVFGYAAKLEYYLAYPRIILAFGQVTAPQFASIPNARDLDAACAGKYAQVVAPVGSPTTTPQQPSKTPREPQSRLG